MKEIIIDGVEYILTPKTEVSDKEEDIILVPDDIKLSEVGGAIAINNGRHHLYYASGFGNWVAGNNDGDELIKCKLVPCKWEDIKVGDLFYRDGSSNPKFNDLIGYAIKLKEGYQFWDGKDCYYSDSEYSYYSDSEYFYYWKVVQL